MKGGTLATRRALLAAIACAGLSGRHALAANDTGRPLRMIVPQAPGGAADFMARLIARELSSVLDRPVVVERVYPVERVQATVRRPVYEGDHVTVCLEQYRSYDPRSDTFLGNDGYRHRCNL